MGSERSKLTPRTVSRMLRSRRESQPSSRKTPRGGRTMAKNILQMSLGGSVSDVFRGRRGAGGGSVMGLT
jgi:hypothetical protein